jgi:hypothetical protein
MNELKKALRSEFDKWMSEHEDLLSDKATVKKLTVALNKAFDGNYTALYNKYVAMENKYGEKSAAGFMKAVLDEVSEFINDVINTLVSKSKGR